MRIERFAPHIPPLQVKNLIDITWTNIKTVITPYSKSKLELESNLSAILPFNFKFILSV